MYNSHWFWNSNFMYFVHQTLLNVTSWLWKKQTGR